MKRNISSIIPSTSRAFDCICVILAVYMTWKQLLIYFQNEDFSEISFKRFTDGTGYNYPTYTICLEDNNLQQIFLTTKVKTKRNCPEDDISISKLCPNGCYLNIENDKLNILNKTIEESCHEQNESSSTTDVTLLDGYDISLQEDDTNSSSSDYYLTFDGNEYLINGLKTNIEDKVKENASTVMRKKRSVSVLQIPENGIHYDLEDRFGEEMMILKSGKKFHVIGPEQYQLLLMGYKLKFNYHYARKDGTSMSNLVAYDINDILDLDFDKVVVNMNNLLQDMKIEMEGGRTDGWTDDWYRYKSTHCLFDKDYVDDKDLSSILKSGTCDERISLKRAFEKRNSIPFPLEKSYQDPTRICYSPRFNQASLRKNEEIVFDLRKMLHSLEGEFKKFSNKRVYWENSMMRFYIHMKGQFIRGISRPAAALSSRFLSLYCFEPPTPDINNWVPHYDYCSGVHVSFDVSQVTLLRSRHDAKKTCNNSLKDEDSKILQSLINDKKLSCVPSYWKWFDFSSGLQVCNETSQYRFISDISANFTDFGTDERMKEIRQRFDPSCEELHVGTNFRREKGREFRVDDFNQNGKFDENETGLYLDIKIRNTNPIFQIIENGQSFTLEGCFAGIGGFVGIFVGLSLRQLPQIFIQLVRFIQKAMK